MIDLYYLATPFCARAEKQIFQVGDILVHVIHPDNLFNFICANSDKVKLINYTLYLQDHPESEKEFEKAFEWFKTRFSGELSLGMLPDFPRNKNS